MNVLIKGRVERKADRFDSIKKKAKQLGLVAEWKVIDGKLLCQWRKS